MRMTTTKKDHDTGTEYFKHVSENAKSIPPGDVTIILTLPQRPGGEMYGM